MLTTGALRPVLDVSGLAPGRHVKELQLVLDNKYIVGETVISFTISSENSDGDEPDASAGSDNGEEDSSGQNEDNPGNEPDKDTDTDTDDSQEPDANQRADTDERAAEPDEETGSEEE